MADLGMEFDHSTVEKSAFDGDLIPTGTEALAHCTESDVIIPKSGQGKMLKCRWDILDGPYERRVIFDQINFQHASAKAQLIGQQRLKSICEAVGHEGPLTNSDDIMFKPIRIKIGIRKGSEQYPDPQNEIKAFKSADGRSTTAKPGTPGAASTARSTMNGGSAASKPSPISSGGAAPAKRPWGNRA